MKAWHPGNNLPFYQPLIALLTSTVYECNVPGKDKRLITFKPSGEIGKGQCEQERYWDLREQAGIVWLDIYSENRVTLSVTMTAKGEWQGNYRQPENKAIILKACKRHMRKKKNKPIQSSHNNMIHVRLSGQLGNCLRNIASVSILAKHIGAGWDVDFNQCYTPQEVCMVLAGLFPQKLRWYETGSYIPFDERKLLRFNSIYGTNSHPIVEATVVHVPSFRFGIRHIYAFRPYNMSEAEYVQQKIAFYRNICWPEDFPERAQKFFHTIGRNRNGKMVGCHIRYTDNLTDRVKSNLGLNTPFQVFIEKLGSLKDTAILLCTDNEDVKKQVSKQLPSLSVFYPDKYNIENIWQPLYEMFLLSKTDYIIGSYSSTFSYEACFMGGIAIELYENDQWTLYPLTYPAIS